jgi:acetyl-CoA synthase
MSVAVAGALQLIEEAERAVGKAVASGFQNHRLAFQGTAFHLPLAHALTGFEGGPLTEANCLLDRARELAKARLEGLAALLACELMCLVRSTKPTAEEWVGFVPDGVLRALGVQFADGRIAGMCLVVGAPPEPELSTRLVRQAQERNLLTLLCGDGPRGTILDHLRESGVRAGLETFVVPLEPTIHAASHAAGVMVRLALMFGRVRGGDREQVLEYCRQRVKATCLLLSPAEPSIVALLSGMGRLGVQTATPVSSENLQEVPGVIVPAAENLVVEAAEARGIKVSVAELDLPVPYGPAFEGERVRKEEMRIEIGGRASTAFELLVSAPTRHVRDGEVVLRGPDLPDARPGGALSVGLVVTVGGDRMQEVFEPVLERHIHAFLNQASGVFHVGQRNHCWLRISNMAYDAGLRLRHLGTVLHGMIHKTFGRFVDRVAVEILTIPELIEQKLPLAADVYRRRDQRIADLSDEAVETFYSCAMCQSFAPTHLCVLTPERMGLCGAYTWLDAKACHEIDPTGPNQPVAKGNLLDAERGEWEGVNRFVARATNGAHHRFCAYSVMHFPETSCGCFECIVAVVPEANGFQVVHREYDGQTPIGMSFSTLAGAVGGGQQNPGFMGVARRHVVSPKFVRADGGLARVVWMPGELKATLYEDLVVRGEEAGHPNLPQRIADEGTATDLGSLLAFLERVSHPALTMPPLL